MRNIMKSGFDEVKIQHIPRWDNMQADTLSKLASTKHKEWHKSHLQQALAASSTTNICLNIDKVDNWMTPYIQYLKTGNPLANADKGWPSKAARYTMVGDTLNKRGYREPLLKCITREQTDYLIRKIHEGICEYHSGSRIMTTRILKVSYFWPTMEADCHAFIKKYTMSETWQPHSLETRTVALHTFPVAIRKVRDGYFGTVYPPIRGKSSSSL